MSCSLLVFSLVLGKLLGVADIFCVLVIMVISYLPHTIISFAAWFLILKGFMFAMMKNFISWLDVAAGLYILLLAKGIGHWIPTLIVVIFLGQKGLFSLV